MQCLILVSQFMVRRNLTSTSSFIIMLQSIKRRLFPFCKFLYFVLNAYSDPLLYFHQIISWSSVKLNIEKSSLYISIHSQNIVSLPPGGTGMLSKRTSMCFPNYSRPSQLHPAVSGQGSSCPRWKSRLWLIGPRTTEIEEQIRKRRNKKSFLFLAMPVRKRSWVEMDSVSFLMAPGKKIQCLSIKDWDLSVTDDHLNNP